MAFGLVSRARSLALCGGAAVAVLALFPAAGLAGAAWEAPPNESSTAQSPVTHVRATDRSSIRGVWETHTARNDPGHAPMADIPDPPLKPEYKALVDAEARRAREFTARGDPLVNNMGECLPDGFPSMMRSGAFGVEIIVTPGQVTMINEVFSQVRRIYLDEPQGKPGDVEPVFFGHSVGRWEGDTLVVDTIGVKDTARFRNIPHSDQMRVVERIRLVSPDFIEVDTVITDPVTMTGPWRFTWVMKRSPRYKVQEYVCEAQRIYKSADGAQRLRIDPR